MQRRKRVGIAGFGVHGTMLAAQALQCGAVRPEDLVIIDRWDAPGAQFEYRLRSCRTEILRSPHGDHTDPEADSLERYAASCGIDEPALAIQHQRPSARLFTAHLSDVASRYKLADLHHPGLISRIRRDDQGIHIANSGKNLTVDVLFLAMGMVAPNIPEWGNNFRGHDTRVAHVFDRDYEPEHLPESEQAAVVGGGITAVQVARSLVEKRGRRVLLITRSPLDGMFEGASTTGHTSSQDWYDIGRRKQLCSMPYAARVAYLKDKGDHGTIPPWDRAWLADAMKRGDVEHRIAEIAYLDPYPQHVKLILDDDDGTVIPVSLVVLATGLRTQLHDWLIRSAKVMGLPFSGDMPLLDDTLQWGSNSGIYMLGHHAAPVLGPYAGNIAGGKIGAGICCENLRQLVGM